MDDLLIARALHVLSIVVWIGGVAFVTLIGLPLARRQPTAAQKLALFEAIEGPFSRIARWTVGLAGLSGLWMLRSRELWYRFTEPGFWWMWAMVGLWLVFAVMLYIVEPFWLRRHAGKAKPDFTRMIWLHGILLAAAAVTIAGAVIGSH